MSRSCTAALVTLLAITSIPAADSRSLLFSWDFAPLRYDLDVGDDFGREISRGGEFDKNDRAALRYLNDMDRIGGAGSWSAGGGVPSGRHDDDDLRFET